MKRYLLVALVVLTVTPGLASAQMMGRGMSEGGAAAMPPAQKEMKPQMAASGMDSGMMGQGHGMMSDMMGGCMKSGGMMGGMGQGQGMMSGMMGSGMMDGMMSGQTRGSMMMAEGMMKGQVDMVRMRKGLALSDDQVERLRSGLRPLQKESILALASMKVAELELSDLIAGEKVDFSKVEAKLKEIEGIRAKVRLANIKAAVAVKGVVSKEQLEKLQEAGESNPPPAPISPQKGATPQTDSEHEQHH